MLTIYQKFYFLIFVVKVVPVTDLVKRLEAGKRRTKEAVVNDSESILIELFLPG
jgi:E3 SUMO-protein ligase PIAS1